MDLEYENGDFDILQSYYIEFLKNRNKILRTKFLNSLGYYEEIEEAVTKKEVIESSSIDGKFFRTTKIGELVRIIMDYLIANELLSDEDILKLREKSYSKKLGIWLPVLVASEHETKDASGRTRYYTNPLLINGKNYYLCREWKEDMRKPFVEWAKTKIGSEFST